MTRRVHNFSAGPAVLPEPVLRQAAAEMLDWRGSGMGVMEMSHRGPEFTAIHQEALALLRELMAVPADYRILFMQGGALAQNAIVPLNLLRGRPSIDFVDTGIWSQKSIAEARRYAAVNIAASAAAGGYTDIPARPTWRLDARSAYLHICGNETIGGVEYPDTPVVDELPLVADLSSSILSRPIEVARHALIYAGAQKNIGPAGLTIVIVREDLIGHARADTPAAFDYRVVADNDSLYNTPPTWAIYVAGLVFGWLRDQGGVAAMAERNRAKAELLYGALDASGVFTTRVARAARSRMNVTFDVADARLLEPFLAGAHERGLVQLRGHRSVGGVRASLYNALPIEAVQALVDWMRAFEARHG